MKTCNVEIWIRYIDVQTRETECRGVKEEEGRWPLVVRQETYINRKKKKGKYIFTLISHKNKERPNKVNCTVRGPSWHNDKKLDNDY